MKKFWIISVFVVAGLGACKKDTYVGKDPYGNARPPLDVKLKTVTEIAEASVGTLYHLSGSGFEQYKDSGMVVKFDGVKGTIEKLSDTSLDVRIPPQASSGMVTLTIDRQIFPGPQIRVKGNLYIDAGFTDMPGSDGVINCVAAQSGGKWLLGGAFGDYGNSGEANGFKGLISLNPDGTLNKGFVVGKGFNGSVAALAVQADGRIVAGGNFMDYNDRFVSNPVFVRNIVRLLPGGALDTTKIITKTGTALFVPTIDAFFDGTVSKIIQSPVDGKLTILGNFNYLIRKDFTASTSDGLRDSIVLDSIRMEGLARLTEKGDFDSTFNYNKATGRSGAGLNGSISDAILLPDGRLLLAGNFSRFHGKPANGLTVLDDSGEIDPAFSTGSGPNAQITAANVLSDGRIIVAGLFSSFNGVNARKVVMLSTTGTVETGFSVGSGATAGPDLSISHILQLRNGKILLTGNFEKFSGISRKGLAVLDENGGLAEGFNSLGAMVGNIKQIEPVAGANGVLMVGLFSKFDLTAVGNIVQLRY